jgi:hypothetical protein
MNDIIKQICQKIKGLLQPAFLLEYNKTGNDDTGASRRGFFFIKGRAQHGYIFSPYGLCTNPPLGSSGVVFNMNAGDSHPVGMVDYAAKRFKDLKSGEVVVGNYETGSYIKFLENGDIKLYTAGNILLDGSVYGAEVGTPVLTPAGIKAPTQIINDAHIHNGVEAGPSTTGGAVTGGS